jgi:hypothetical protein
MKYVSIIIELRTPSSRNTCVLSPLGRARAPSLGTVDAFEAIPENAKRVLASATLTGVTDRVRVIQVSVCVRACVRARVRACVRAFLSKGVRCACVHVCMRACVRASVCV